MTVRIEILFFPIRFCTCLQIGLSAWPNIFISTRNVAGTMCSMAVGQYPYARNFLVYCPLAGWRVEMTFRRLPRLRPQAYVKWSWYTWGTRGSNAWCPLAVNDVLVMIRSVCFWRRSVQGRWPHPDSLSVWTVCLPPAWHRVWGHQVWEEIWLPGHPAPQRMLPGIQVRWVALFGCFHETRTNHWRPSHHRKL
jgi:hypothetical protein